MVDVNTDKPVGKRHRYRPAFDRFSNVPNAGIPPLQRLVHPDPADVAVVRDDRPSDSSRSAVDDSERGA
jgi:hypothetical protein